MVDRDLCVDPCLLDSNSLVRVCLLSFLALKRGMFVLQRRFHLQLGLVLVAADLVNGGIGDCTFGFVYQILSENSGLG